MHPTVTALKDRPGLEILDPIENTRFVLHTAEAVTPAEIPTDQFDFLVDTLVTIEVSEIRIPQLTGLYIHSPDDVFVGSFEPTQGPLTWDTPCRLEVNVAPTKLYLAVATPFTVSRDGNHVVLDFHERTDVQVGVRSLHERPAATIQTTTEPRDMMRALSCLGSALKTSSPERSFPTLRGHPPLIELGDEFDAPEELEHGETNIRLELPPTYEYLYPAASLAYYLNADVVPADDPRLVTTDGFERSLEGPNGYEETVSQILRQIFFFDCVTRTEGLYSVDLHERQTVEGIVDLDFEVLYEQSVSKRVAAYLSVPFGTVEPYIPEWNLTADVKPTSESLAAVPYLVNDLALIRTIGPGQLGGEKASEEVHQAVDEFHRSGDSSSSLEPVAPEPAETIEHAWVGDGIPIRANKVTVDSLRRGLDVDPDTTIDVHVVCNDELMREEDVVAEYYELRELPKFDVSVHYDLTTDEVRALLATPADFVHFVSHVTEEGMVCADGYLDARTLNNVEIKAFALNACASYKQGMALLAAGSLGGVITLYEVGNTSATLVGTALARALAAGYSLRLGVEVARRASHATASYTTIGDGGLRLCQCEETNPMLLRAEPCENGIFRTEVAVYPSPTHGLGTAYELHLDSIDAWYLVGGVLDTFNLSTDQFVELLDNSLKPIEYDGELLWSDDVSVSDFQGPG